jgi:iron complex transport system substrate-binding protein
MLRRHVIGLIALLAFGPAAAGEIEPFADTSRLVAIGGSLTEIVYALGEGDRLVARDSTALYPEAALQLPDIGYMRQLSPEGVLSVNPSALLVLAGSGPPETLDVLSRVSVPQVVVPERYSADGIVEKVRIVGAALGVPDRAARLAGELDAQLKAAEAVTAGITEKQRVLFILSLEGGKVMASGTGTAAAGIIQMAGAENAITDYQGYKTLTDEALIAAAPDVILMMTREGGAITDDELFSQPGIALTPAGKNRQAIRLEGAYLLGFGPRTAAAITELASDLYGDALDRH